MWRILSTRRPLPSLSNHSLREGTYKIITSNLMITPYDCKRYPDVQETSAAVDWGVWRKMWDRCEIHWLRERRSDSNGTSAGNRHLVIVDGIESGLIVYEMLI